MTLLYFPKTSLEAKIPIVPIEDFDIELPLFRSVQAGFPSPADDHVEAVLNLQELIVKDSACTFMVRVEGESMIRAGIYPGDMLVVDRSIEPINGDVVVAFINNEYTVKELHRLKDRIELRPANPTFAPITVSDGDELIIWGVVTTNLRMFRKP
jgi:DNA polymerase V